MIPISRSDARTLAIGATVVALIVGAGQGLPRLRSWESASLSVAAEAGNRVRMLRQDSATVARFGDSVNVRAARLDAIERALVHGRTPDAAAAAFASMMERVAERHNVGLFTVTLNADSVARFGFARVTVRISGETDVAGLADLLYAIESQAAPMSIRELLVSQPEPMAPTSRMETLRVDLSVQTIARVDSIPRRKATS